LRTAVQRGRLPASQVPALTQTQTQNGESNGNSFISGYITLLLRAEPFSTGRFQQPGLNMPYGVVGIENICEIAARYLNFNTTIYYYMHAKVATQVATH
jgi:hypothetical protein